MHNEPNKHIFTCELKEDVKGASQVHCTRGEEAEHGKLIKYVLDSWLYIKPSPKPWAHVLKLFSFEEKPPKKQLSFLSPILILFILVTFQKVFVLSMLDYCLDYSFCWGEGEQSLQHLRYITATLTLIASREVEKGLGWTSQELIWVSSPLLSKLCDFRPACSVPQVPHLKNVDHERSPNLSECKTAGIKWGRR